MSDLLQAGAASQVAGVAPIHAITKPMSNTKTDPVWFFCTLPTASMHRQDGKKLPFVNSFYKAVTVEDIAYLTKEVEDGNPYIRIASPDEVSNVRMQENPVEAIKDQVRAEVENTFTVEELQALIAKRQGGAASNVAHTTVAAQGSASTGTTGIASTSNFGNMIKSK